MFSTKDHQIWKQLFTAQTALRDKQLMPEFLRGLESLEIGAASIPDITSVNKKLQNLTGWQGVYTKGFVEAEEFFRMLARKKFPVGSFIRNPEVSMYTPEPDVFHDLYGHLPFLADQDYADFCQEFGLRALQYKNHPQISTEFQRLFWFTIEFALVKTPAGIRILGAGIASSFNECAYALSLKPRVHSFDVDDIRKKEFRTDLMQEDLFLLESTSQLYSCLDDFEKCLQGRGT